LFKSKLLLTKTLNNTYILHFACTCSNDSLNSE